MMRVVKLDERAMEILDLQLQAFRTKFGREPGPDDPVFFDPEADEPRPLDREKYQL
jgi:hypothetical protein